MAKAIAKGAAEDTWEETKNLVYSTSRRFALCFLRKDLPEIISEAHYHYQLAYADYNYKLGWKFSTYAGFRIWKGLLETYRTERRRGGILRQTQLSDNHYCPEKSEFDLKDFLNDLTDDGVEVVSLVLSAHPDTFKRYGDGFVEPRNGRKAVRELLADMGWDKVRINRAFRIIRSAL